MQSKDLLLIALGHSSELANQVRRNLLTKGIGATVFQPLFINPPDFDLFSHLLSTHRFVATIVEEGSNGGMGLMINNFLIRNGIQQAEILHFGTPDMWVQFGSNTELMRELGLDAESIADRILKEFFGNVNCPLSKREEKAIV